MGMNLFKVKSFFGLDETNDTEYHFDEPVDNFEPSITEEKITTNQYESHPPVNESSNTNVNNVDTQKEPAQPSFNQYTNKKVVDMNQYQTTTDKNNFKQVENRRVHRKITVFEPREYTDCKLIAQGLFRKEIVIITFSAMEELQARRVVDFVTGAVYAVDGDIQRIGEEIFICTPANVDIDSGVAQSLIATHLADY